MHSATFFFFKEKIHFRVFTSETKNKYFREIYETLNICHVQICYRKKLTNENQKLFTNLLK